MTMSWLGMTYKKRREPGKHIVNQVEVWEEDELLMVESPPDERISSQYKSVS